MVNLDLRKKRFGNAGRRGIDLETLRAAVIPNIPIVSSHHAAFTHSGVEIIPKTALNNDHKGQGLCAYPHLNEKWFCICKKSQKYYLSEDEDTGAEAVQEQYTRDQA